MKTNMLVMIEQELFLLLLFIIVFNSKLELDYDHHCIYA